MHPLRVDTSYQSGGGVGSSPTSSAAADRSASVMSGGGLHGASHPHSHARPASSTIRPSSGSIHSLRLNMHSALGSAGMQAVDSGSATRYSTSPQPDTAPSGRSASNLQLTHSSLPTPTPPPASIRRPRPRFTSDPMIRSPTHAPSPTPGQSSSSSSSSSSASATASSSSSGWTSAASTARHKSFAGFGGMIGGASDAHSGHLPHTTRPAPTSAPRSRPSPFRSVAPLSDMHSILPASSGSSLRAPTTPVRSSSARTPSISFSAQFASLMDEADRHEHEALDELGVGMGGGGGGISSGRTVGTSSPTPPSDPVVPPARALTLLRGRSMSMLHGQHSHSRQLSHAQPQPPPTSSSSSVASRARSGSRAAPPLSPPSLTDSSTPSSSLDKDNGSPSTASNPYSSYYERPFGSASSKSKAHASSHSFTHRRATSNADDYDDDDFDAFDEADSHPPSAPSLHRNHSNSSADDGGGGGGGPGSGGNGVSGTSKWNEDSSPGSASSAPGPSSSPTNVSRSWSVPARKHGTRTPLPASHPPPLTTANTSITSSSSSVSSSTFTSTSNSSIVARRPSVSVAIPQPSSPPPITSTQSLASPPRSRAQLSRSGSVFHSSANGSRSAAAAAASSDATSPSTGSSHSGPSSLTSTTDEGVYIPSADLVPHAHPASAIPDILRNLHHEDWSQRFDAMTNLRRIVVHNPELVPTHIKSVVRDLKTEVGSLRSSLAKHSLMALADLFTHLGRDRGLESELEQVGPALLKRAGETAGFIREEAYRALMLMIQHCSDRHTLPILLNTASMGSKVTKSIACVFLDRAVEVLTPRLGSGIQNNKEYQRLLKIVGGATSDASSESRMAARNTIIRLCKVVGIDELDKQIKKVITPAQYHTVQKLLSKGMDTLNNELAASVAQQHVPSASVLMSPPSASATKRFSVFSSSSSSSSATAGGSGHSRDRASISVSAKSSSSSASSSTHEFDLGLSSVSSMHGGAAGGIQADYGLDSVSRKSAKETLRGVSSRRMKAASANASGNGNGAGGGSSTSSHEGGLSSSKTTSSRGKGGPGKGGNMFDLDDPAYNLPLSATSNNPPSNGSQTSPNTPAFRPRSHSSANAPPPLSTPSTPSVALSAANPATWSAAANAQTAPSRASAKRRPALSAQPRDTSASASKSPDSSSSSNAAAAASSSSSSSSFDSERFSTILADLSSSEWRTRLESLESLRSFLQALPPNKPPPALIGQASKLFDALAQRINDHHGKVNVTALQSLVQIIPVTKTFITPVLSTFLPSLASHLSSTNPAVRQLTHQAFDTLLNTLDPSCKELAENPQAAGWAREAQAAMIAPLSHIALYDNVKVRPLIIEKLCQLLTKCAEADLVAASNGIPVPPLLTTCKSAIPVAYALVEEGRSEIRAPLLKCAQLLYAMLGSGLWEEKVCMQHHLTQQQVQKLKLAIHA